MLRRLIEAYGAWRRGERRVAPHGVRGRVYERKGEAGSLTAMAQPTATIKARVFRAATGKWEDVR